MQLACSQQINSVRGQPRISQEVVGTSIVLLVSLLPLTELRKSRDVVGESGVEMVDLQGIDNEHERAKALS